MNGVLALMGVAVLLIVVSVVLTERDRRERRRLRQRIQTTTIKLTDNERDFAALIRRARDGLDSPAKGVGPSEAARHDGGRGRRGGLDDDDRDAGAHHEVPGVPAAVLDDYHRAVDRVAQALRQGGRVLIVTEPDVVGPVEQLLHLIPSRTSVAGTPEGTGAAGHPGSAAPPCRPTGDRLASRVGGWERTSDSLPPP